MAGPRARSNSVRRARGLSIGEDGKPVPLKRWDGASRTCRDWDGLRRDPEIWERNGNCLVHLYAKGDSKRGPSFKLPFAALLSAGCLPLIEKFLVLDGLASNTARAIERWDQLHPRSTAELYIPAPPHASERQTQHYHLAIRNLCAWVLGRPMVGGHLGSALVTLLHSMREFRSTPGNNVDDLLMYMYQAQYLDMAEAPIHATAVLHLAETFRLSDLYKRAFAHCVGMHDRLFYSSEYQLISAASRALVRRARLEMNAMLQQTSNRLRSFLDDELSETNLGIPDGTRAHLERFRSFLLSFYAAKLGYYPPRTFSAGLLNTMAEDFDALYELLVDSDYTVSDIIPSRAVGGICTEQLVQTFDENNSFEPLPHPLPQLPQLESSSLDGLRCLTKLPFVDKVATGQRQVTVAALITASNWTEKCFKNDLVQAYRRFEEDAILSPSKADRSEKISLLEARKVRWLLIYAVHQVLRCATRIPIEVRGEEASYHLTVSMAGTPPWSSGFVEAKQPLRIQTDLVAPDELPTKRTVKIQEAAAAAVGKVEIKPDIDYFALTHKSRNPSMSTLSDKSSPTTLSRSSSFSITSLRRNSTIRRSLRKFRRGSMSGSQPSTTPPLKPLYHEIVVQGYGNGTQAVTVELDDEGLTMKGTLAGRSDSTASTQSNMSSSTTASSVPESMSSTIDTLSTSALSSPTTPTTDASLELELMLARWGPQDKAPVRMGLPRSASVSAISGQLDSLAAGLHSYSGALDRKEDVKRKRRSLEPARAAPAPAALQRRYTMLGDLGRKSFGFEAKPISVRIRENSITEEAWTPSRRDSDDWSMMLAFMDGNEAEAKAKTTDAWAQYADLGGLTDMS